MTYSNDITQKAMLVKVSVSCWSGTLRDNLVSEEVIRMKSANLDAGTWSTRLVPKDILSSVRRPAQVVREAMYDYTLPWTDNGTRILPTSKYVDFTRRIREAVQHFEDAVEVFLKTVEVNKHAYIAQLGDLAKSIDFPTIDELKEKFKVEVEFLPLPSSRDFRANLGEASEIVKAEMQKQIDTKMGETATYLWHKIETLVSKMNETLSKPDQIFRNSLVDNLKNFIDEIDAFNLTNNQDIADMAATIKEMIPSTEKLREDKEYRNKAVENTAEILNKIKTYM